MTTFGDLGEGPGRNSWAQGVRGGSAVIAGPGAGGRGPAVIAGFGWWGELLAVLAGPKEWGEGPGRNRWAQGVGAGARQ